MNSNVVDVGIGEIVICRSPHVLRTVLGSCVALCLIDLNLGIAGMAHIVLPAYNGRDKKDRFADTGFEILLEKILAEGAIKQNLVARIAGGARMNIIKDTSPFANIGLNNAAVVKELLLKNGIPLKSEKIGGVRGLTVKFSAETGELLIRELSPMLS